MVAVTVVVVVTCAKRFFLDRTIGCYWSVCREAKAYDGSPLLEFKYGPRASPGPAPGPAPDRPRTALDPPSPDVVFYTS